jgi:23S rRNA pseudouridine2604 synthase
MAEPVRLAKRVAAMVPCSRREAEQYIEGGWVRVDGVVVETPQHRVTEAQRVELDRKAVAEPAQAVTFVLNKPAGQTYEEAMASLARGRRWSGDTSGVRTVARNFANLTPLLPMPAAANGLAVYTQDFRIARKLTEDALLIEQELIADVAGTIADNGLQRLHHGLSVAGPALPPIKVSWQNETRLRFAVKGFDPAYVESMCTQVGLRLTALKRIRLGRIPMAALPAGEWRCLHRDERF